MSNSDHTRSSPAGNSSSMYGAESPVATQTPHSGGGTDYRTSIQFLTSSTSQPSHDVSADVIMEEEPSSSVPVSALLAPQDNHRQAITVPARTQYREDELTGMQGLMELASPEHTPLSPEHTPLRPIINHGVHSASSSASSGSTSTFSVPPALNISSHGGSRPANTLPPMQAHQRFHTYHSATTMAGSPASAATTLTPDSMPSVTPGAVRSFPATLDDSRMARRRSQSTDSPHHQQSGGLPHVLGNANIRDRSFTFTQRQRTSDTPLFPILLHRIIEEPKNESWIRWTEDGTAFKFSSSEKLLAALQAAGLRAQNYHSVEKNLNDYRFNRLTDQRRKIPDTDGKLWWMFSHAMFHRDYPDQIVNIQRRRRTNPPTMSPQPPIIATQQQQSQQQQSQQQQQPMPPIPQQYMHHHHHHMQQPYQVLPPHAAQHQNHPWL